jgi:hypothetical protein
MAAAVFLGGCVQASFYASETRDAQADASDDSSVLAKIPDAVRRDLEHGRARDLLIELVDKDPSDAGVLDAGESDASSAPLARSVRDEDETVRERAERYRQLQDRVLEQAASDSLELKFQYENVPLLHVRVQDLAGLVGLTRLPEVLVVHEDVAMDNQLTESLPLIQQPAVAANGQLGAGTAVAVLDTGCDFTRAAFGSCSAAGSACKVAYAADFGTGDNVRDTNYHGTNVSAIVLGVAPATKILALDVFEGNVAYSSTIIKAIDWAITNRATYNIVAMNMSLGSGAYTAACSADVFATAVGNARNAGILSAIASGNGSYTSAISSPACVPTAISVGAVYDANVGGLSYSACSDSSTSADKVTCFSNSASFLSMLAPGAPITAGGVTMTGTSQASPHVAGAIAVARAAFPTEPINATVSRLVNSGPNITDSRNGVTLHRLDLNAALGGAGVVDVTAPTGTLKINQGATATKLASVSLALSASDDGGALSMCISNTASCTAFSTFATTKTWTLATGNGMKTVYVTLRDPSNNRTTLTASIMLDALAPTGGTLSATPANAQVQLSWTAATDANSGVASYKVQAATNSATAPTCTAGTTIYSGSALAFTHSGITNGTQYAYRVCPVDAAGNVGTGVTATARPAPEFDGPVGSVTINAGATYTNKAAVSLSLAATDASGVASVCISNTATCTTFTAFAATKAWTMANINGTATVRVWFKDIYGNVSASPVSDTIILDSTVPTASTISAVPSDASVTLTWTASTDASSGLAGYKVVSALNTAPTCAAGTTVFTGTTLTTVVTGLTNGSLYAYRVCPFDTAGNFATGGTTTARPAPEFDGPTGSVVINAAAQYTNSRNVTLTLSATDVSGVAAVCISNTAAACTTFSAFAQTKPWALAVASGTATVRVWFRDTYGNVSAAAVSDTILVDTTPPASNTLSALVTSGAAALRWTASSDTGSGLAGYRLRFAPTRAPTCTTGTEIYSGTELSFIHTGLTNGSVYAYRVCPFDVAGNAAAAGTVTATPN